jgi:hypothetical protein
VSLPAASSPTNGGLYTDPGGAWTWTASPLQDDAGQWHLYVDRFTNGCGVLHYCSNGEVAHAVAPSVLGPYTFSDLALAPRAGLFDSGACNDVTAARLPNGSWALFYMGAAEFGSAAPNCTTAYDPAEGNRGSRRIGLALAASPFGPWARAAEPLLGPCTKGPHCWDDSDVSNPAPLLAEDGSVTLLYKGRGGKGQHVGVAWARGLEGPWTRAPQPLPTLPGEDPWVWRTPDGLAHVLLHTGAGSGATWGGSHAFSLDGGRTWNWTGVAYTGAVAWSNGSAGVLARRERPQGVLDAQGRLAALFNAAQACIPAQDWGVACRSFSMAVPLL